MEEIEWYDIIEYEGFYKITKEGIIKNRYGKIMKPSIDAEGYHRHALYKNKIKRRIYLHQILALNFMPNPENKPFINHKNGIKGDNRLENLEWCTNAENVQHSYDFLNRVKSRLGLTGEKCPCSKPVAQYDLQMNLIKIWSSTMDIQRELGFANSNISSCCLGKTSKAYGFIWRYL